MNIELERIGSEDDVAHAGVERAGHTADARVEAQRQQLARKIDDAVARILADAERDVATRRAHRARWLQEYAVRADALLEAGTVTCAGIIRDRPRKKTL